MLQALLAERFKLVAHHAQEEHKVLALVAGKGGPKMKEAATVPQAFDPNSPLQPGERQVDDADGPMRIKMNPTAPSREHGRQRHNHREVRPAKHDVRT